MRSIGLKLIPIEFPASINADNLRFILHTEASAAFDEIVQNGRIDLIKTGDRPYVLRIRQFVPGVEYIQANRVRTILMQDLNKALKDAAMDPVHTEGYNVNIEPGADIRATIYTYLKTLPEYKDCEDT